MGSVAFSQLFDRVNGCTFPIEAPYGSAWLDVQDAVEDIGKMLLATQSPAATTTVVWRSMPPAGG